MQITISLSHLVRPLQANRAARNRVEEKKKKEPVDSSRKNDQKNLADPFLPILSKR